MDDIISVRKTGEKFKISWKMTSWCNYRCSYCYMAKEVAKGNNHTPFEKILAIAERLDGIIERQAKGRNVELHMIGGEVCVYDLVQVLEKIQSLQLKIIIVATNFSAPVDYWKRLKDYCFKRGILPKIIASFHLEQCDREKFVKKAIAVNASVKCVVNSRNINEYRPYFEKLRKAGNKIQVTIERDNINSCEQLKGKDLEYVNFLNNEMKKDSKPYFVVAVRDGSVHEFGTNIEFINSIDVGGFDPHNFICTAGIDGIRIAQDGSVRRAGCRHASVSQNRLGSIFDDDILEKLPTEPWICKTTEAGKDGIMMHKMCTCFGNASMWRS